jgi:hypothetical protein
VHRALDRAMRIDGRAELLLLLLRSFRLKLLCQRVASSTVSCLGDQRRRSTLSTSLLLRFTPFAGAAFAGAGAAFFFGGIAIGERTVGGEVEVSKPSLRLLRWSGCFARTGGFPEV